MPSPQTTCWTLIGGAAAGNEIDRQAFARRYESVVRAYLGARWAATPLSQDLDDATQEVFVEAFRAGGALERADPAQPGGFRAFLFGVVRNVALRFEKRRARDRARDVQPPSGFLDSLSPEEEMSLSKVFDRHWAGALMREAARRQHEGALGLDEAAVRRVELLRLRFHDGLPVRAIAARWNVDPVHLHREYARARREFRDALLEVVKFHCRLPEDAERRCAELLEML